MRRPLLILLLILLAAAAYGALVYGRHLHRSEQPGVLALEDAVSRLRTAPRDPNAWAALGDVQANLDQLHAAEESYRSALRLGGADGQLFARLGFLLYGWGRDDDALEALEQAAALGAETPLLQYTIAQLRQKIAGPEPSPEPKRQLGTAVIEPHPDRECAVDVTRTSGHGTWCIETEVNGIPSMLIVDTGASLTALDRDLIADAGAVIDEARTINAITAAGPAVFPTAVVETITVAGRTVEALRVAVCDACAGRAADGLLGLDVQAPLGMGLDIQDGVVRFADCE